MKTINLRAIQSALIADRLNGKPMQLQIQLENDDTIEIPIIARIGFIVVHHPIPVDPTFPSKAWILAHEPTTKYIAAFKRFIDAIAAAHYLQEGDSDWSFTDHYHLKANTRERAKEYIDQCTADGLCYRKHRRKHRH